MAGHENLAYNPWPAVDSGTGWTSIVASEAAFFNILIQFWANGDFPKAASVSVHVPADNDGCTGCTAVATILHSVDKY